MFTSKMILSLRHHASTPSNGHTLASQKGNQSLYVLWCMYTGNSWITKQVSIWIIGTCQRGSFSMFAPQCHFILSASCLHPAKDEEGDTKLSICLDYGVLGGSALSLQGLFQLLQRLVVQNSALDVRISAKNSFLPGSRRTSDSTISGLGAPSSSL